MFEKFFGKNKTSAEKGESAGMGTRRERLFSRKHLRVWEQIKDDKQLLGILAEFGKGDFAQRSNMVLADVKDFLRKYPDLEIFRSKAGLKEFLEDVETENGPEKRAQYEEKLLEFEKIIYGTN